MHYKFSGYVKKIKVQKEEVQKQRNKVNEAHGKTKEKMTEVNELAKKIKGGTMNTS